MSKSILKLFLGILFVLVNFQILIAEERTLTPPKDYKGDMYVVIKMDGYRGYEECSEIKIIWGPWETESLSAISSARSLKPLAIRLEKKKRDQVPLTVIANCPASIELLQGEPNSRNYEIRKPNWRKR